MAYIVTYDDDFLFDPYTNDDAIYDASISANVNASAYFDFSITSKHRMYNTIAERAGIVKVYSDSKLLFMGEITDIDEDFYGSKTVSCVDPRDRLSDVLLRPYSTVSGEQPNTAPSSVDGYFQWLIDQYNEGMINAKFKFDVGVNQGAYLDKNNYIYRSSEQFPSVASELEDKILDSLGGYLTLSYPNGTPTLNLYADVHEANTQIIDFGVNLIDFSKATATSDQYTAIRPVGGIPEKNDDDSNAEDQKAVTLESLGDGITSVDSDYVKKGDVVYCLSAVNRYGYKEYNWNEGDTLDPQELLEKAVADLKKKVEPKLTIEVKAVDMALFMDGYDHLECGQVARVRSKPHDVDEYLLVSSMDIDLQDPSQTKYTLGQAYDSLTGEQSSFVKSLNAGINSSLDAVAGLDQTVKDQGILIDQANNNAITAIEDAQEAQQKADQAQQAANAASDLAQDSLEQAQQAHDLAEQIQSVVNEVTGDVDQIKTDMEQAEADLAATSQKADQALNKANELAGSIENVTTEISGLQDDFDGLQVTVSGAVENANEALTQVSQTKTDLEGFKTSVSQTYSTKTELDDAIAQEVADRNAAIQVGIDGISATVSQNYTELTGKVNDAQADADAALKAAQSNAEDLTNFANEVSGDLTDLQSQIDGSIQTWFYAGVPTLANQPANQWTDSTTRNNHLGDLYYDTSTGYAYRFMLQNDTYSWGKITDSDVTKALQDAAKAQDTADNKRRVFVTTPTPPYDVGDLWVQGSGGDIKRCQTAKTSAQSYTEADWILASKYTDDSALNDYKGVVATTYATKSSLTQTANEIRAEVSESYQVKGDYATSDDLDDAIAQEVLDRNSAISQSASQIQSTVSQTYATKTDLNTVGDKADAAQSAADSVQDDLDDYKATVSETYATKSSVTQTADAIRSEVAAEYTTKTEFEGLQIGGRNLAIGTQTLDLEGDAPCFGSIDEEVKWNTCVSNPTINAWAGFYIRLHDIAVRNNLKVGDILTVSQKFMVNFEPEKNVSFHYYRADGDGNVGGYISFNADDISANTWYTVSFTIPVTSSILDEDKANQSVGANKSRIETNYYTTSDYYFNDDHTAIMYFAAPKVELGTKPTDWSPAPEDMASTEYVQTTYATKTALEQTENSITASVEAKYLSKTDASSTYATKTQLEQTEDSITSTVSEVQTVANNAYAKASQVEQTADGIQITLTEVETTANNAQTTANTANSNATTAKNNAQTALNTANTANGNATTALNTARSVNLIYNSNFAFGTDNWVAESSTLSVVADSDYRYHLETKMSVASSRIYSNVENVWVSGRTYAYSFYAKASSSGVTIRPSRSLIDYGQTHTLTTSWTRCTGTISCTATVSSGTLSLSFNSSSATYYLANIKLEVGSSATAWTQSPLDAQKASKTATNYLKFDSSGLCVGNMTGTLGYNTLIKSTGVDIRNGSTTLASFEPNQIGLGTNSVSSQIKMCNGTGLLYVDDDGFQIRSNLGLTTAAVVGQNTITGRRVLIDSSAGAITLSSSTYTQIDGTNFTNHTTANGWYCFDGPLLIAFRVVQFNAGTGSNIERAYLNLTFPRSLTNYSISCLAIRGSLMSAYDPDYEITFCVGTHSSTTAQLILMRGTQAFLPSGGAWNTMVTLIGY